MTHGAKEQSSKEKTKEKNLRQRVSPAKGVVLWQKGQRGSHRNALSPTGERHMSIAGPSSSEKTLNEFRKTIKQKRKSAQQNKPSTSNGPSKRAQLQGRRVNCQINPDQFFEVRVDYAHCVDLAKSIGLKPTDVEEAITEDNQARFNADPIDMDLDALDGQDDRIPIDFKPSSGDELDSEMEV